MNKSVFVLAATGWILALAVHLTAVIGHYDLSRSIPAILLLHVGAIAVWLPAVLALRKDPELQQGGLRMKVNPFAFFRVILRHTPKWLRTLAIINFFYATGTLWVFALSHGGGGTPDIEDGKYVLRNRAHITRILTEREYDYYRSNRIGFFAGGWMAFYGVAAAVLFPFGKKQEEQSGDSGHDNQKESEQRI